MRASVLAAVTLSVSSLPAQAALDSSVHIVDTANLVSGLYDQIANHVNAALSDWGRYLVGSAKIDVEFNVTNSVATAAASSRASAYIGDHGAIHVYGAGMAYKVDTGIDVNGATPDIEILCNPTYLLNELWFDPDPYLRQTGVPTNKTDAMSVFIHEVGHALAFNGWGSSVDGSLPGNYASTWDVNTIYKGGELYFTGSNAVALYGGDIPVTIGSNYHIGNASGAGSDLLGDIMNGVSFVRGSRYDISALDLAMAKDMGVNVAAVPEPTSLWLMAAGLVAMWLPLRRRGVTPAA
ncbi:MAG TPA: PEP-CTERM sorting domain-containing protein [Aquabacterium sp.]|nr:PEP-CTERM sorting domain-containing protein [Aquabacterium sp.]